ncbi:putative F-box protein At1g31072 [Pyrus communis]|uniref:putative F-box protein At1g31072 n=1 Tax=Pyrus communis TaxID=23211 RepID=UPI0035C08C93
MSKRKQAAVEDSFRLVDILARLPAKSVVRFKCVSKRWCSILSDQQFAKSQFKFASSQHQRLLFQRHSSSSECLSFDLDPVRPLGMFLLTKSWKRIAAPDKGFGHSTDIINGLLFNEALHWPGYFNWKQQTIVVFDLANEKFRVVPLPIKFQRSTGGAVRPYRLTVAGGCLCVWRTLTMRNEGNLKLWDDQHVDMWVMREYGVSDSLTRLNRFKINKLPDPESTNSPTQNRFSPTS